MKCWVEWVDKDLKVKIIEEVTELEEYHVDWQLFRFMIKQSSRGDGTLNGLIEGDTKLEMGGSVDIFACMRENMTMRYLSIGMSLKIRGFIYRTLLMKS